MHSCIQTSSIQIDSKCMQTFSAQSWTPHCHQDMSEKCSRLRIYLQIFMVTIKQIPTDTSLTASTNAISMQYPNTILNTKMTLPQLVGPIDVVSPEHSSGGRSHEFQIASSKIFLWSVPGAFRLVTTLRLTCGPAGNRTTTGSLSASSRTTLYQLLHRDASNCFLKECQHWFLESRICTPDQSKTRTLYHFTSFVQICTKAEAFLAHQPKNRIFPHIWTQKCGQPSENFVAARKCFASRFATQQPEHEYQHIPFSLCASQGNLWQILQTNMPALTSQLNLTYTLAGAIIQKLTWPL